MATPFWKARDFLFCGVCGTLLDLDNIRHASCPLCGFKRLAKGLSSSLLPRLLLLLLA
jgi:DNA-directed RNA polymerase I subunit RPA12